ncbi:MAG TPA: hypothetical protein VLA34_11285, partial [Candidatus Krumholzibacterium sp.]|nr:hypothetical protein [Candidatus Krumholzibacterium sp.]
ITPLSGVVTVNSSTTVVATIEDQYGNLVTGENLTLYIKDTPDGSLSADLANPNPTDDLGAAIRSGTTDSTGTISVSYDAPAGAGLVDVIDADHAVIPAASIGDVTYTTVASGATKLIVTDISTPAVQAGVTFDFYVRAVDSNNNLDPSNTSHITIVPGGGGLEFSLSDFGAPVTEADLVNGSVRIYGRATTTGIWTSDITASGPVLTATDFDIEVTANDNVHHYVFNTPASATAGVDFTLQLQAKDVYGNLVKTAAYPVSLRAVQPVDTTTAASDVISVVSGNILGGTFIEDNISYQTAEEIRIEVSGGASPVTGVTDIISVGNAPAYQIVETGGDSTGVAAGDSILLRACVYDIFGNTVSGESVSFSILSGGGGLAASQRFTRSDGTTSVSYRTGTTAGLNRVRAAILDGKPEGLETQIFEVSTEATGGISYVTLDIDGSSFAAGEPFGCEVRAYDSFDNLLVTDSSSRLIPVSMTGSVTFLPDTLTLSAGVTSFTAFDTVMGTNELAIETLAGVQLSAWEGPIDISAADAYRITKVSGDTTGVISGDTASVTVRVRDLYGNPVSGEVVRFTVNSDLGGSTTLIDGTGAPGDGLVATGADGSASCSLVTDTNAGVNLLEAAILDGEPAAREKAQFSIVTTAGNISRYVLTTADHVHTAGDHFDVLITAYDLNNNIAYGDFTTVVDLGSDKTAVWDSNPVTLSNGSVTVGVTETLAGRLVLSAETSGGGALSYSDTITVRPGLPSGA